MNVLIVENEVYLARSIEAKLSSRGYRCHIVSNLNEALEDEKYDAVLLSANISGQNFYPVIEKHKNSIIILMISYISNDTVTKPIRAGANDYIQKPFMIEELIRKLEHLREFRAIKKENDIYKNYLNHIFKSTADVQIDRGLKLPLLIKTNSQKTADAFMFKISKYLEKDFKVVSLLELESTKKLDLHQDDYINYLVNFHLIKKNDKNKILALIQDKNVVLVSADLDEDETNLDTITIEHQNDIFETNFILSLENYIKHIIETYQSRFPDTELSKKLGISRKSLWEKRKKYGIEREK